MTMHYEYYINSKTDTMGKNHFVFGCPQEQLFLIYFLPMEWVQLANQARATWLSHALTGVAKLLAGKMCSALIMSDGWQILSDYPIF